MLKRIERLKFLSDKETWKPGDKVFGLPKIKIIKIKMKKEKKVVEKTETAAAGAPGAVAAAPAEQAKGKAPAGKTQAKK